MSDPKFAKLLNDALDLARHIPPDEPEAGYAAAALVAYVDGLRRERDEAHAALMVVHGSIVDASDVPVPSKPIAYGAAVGLIVAQRNGARAERDAAWCAGRDAAARLADVSEDVPAKFAAEIRALTPPRAEDTGP